MNFIPRISHILAGPKKLEWLVQPRLSGYTETRGRQGPPTSSTYLWYETGLAWTVFTARGRTRVTLTHLVRSTSCPIPVSPTTLTGGGSTDPRRPRDLRRGWEAPIGPSSPGTNTHSSPPLRSEEEVSPRVAGHERTKRSDKYSSQVVLCPSSSYKTPRHSKTLRQK